MNDLDVYNESKTKKLDEYDLEKGYLKSDTLTIHHEAIEAIEAEGHYETIREYDNGGKDVEWVIDKPGSDYVEAYDESKEIKIYIPYTEEELKQKEYEDKLNPLLEEMNEYKAYLASTDYEAIKYAEGWLTEEEYAPLKDAREKTREKIRKIEEDIKNLEKNLI